MKKLLSLFLVGFLAACSSAESSQEMALVECVLPDGEKYHYNGSYHNVYDFRTDGSTTITTQGKKIIIPSHSCTITVYKVGS